MKIGIEIGGTKLQIVTANSDGQIDGRYRFDVDKPLGAQGILSNIKSVLDKFSEQLDAIGVGFGGPVDRVTGLVTGSHQIEGWAGINLIKWFGNLTRGAVRVENDANIAALAEAVHGAGKNYDHVFYVTMGSGLGAGMVNHGKIYHGLFPGESELGMLQIDRRGNNLESMCSGWALDKVIRNAVYRYQDHSLLKECVRSGTSNEAKYLADALSKNDLLAWRILYQYADNLAFGLSHIVHLFHPEIIILGGGVSQIGEPLLKSVRESLTAYVVKSYQPIPIIALSSLGEDVVPIGALTLLTK